MTAAALNSHASHLALRAYQERALEQLRDEVRAGRHRLILCASVGAGKTVMASSLIANAMARGKRVLMSAHRRELVRQPFCKLLRYGVPASEVGIVMAGVPLPQIGRVPQVTAAASDAELWQAHARRRPGAPVQIASVDTLRSKDLPENEYDLIIFDECHRSITKSYQKIVERNPNAIIIGLTATPARGDGRGLGVEAGGLYEGLVLAASYGELAAEGYLCVPRVFTTPNLPDVSRVKVVRGDFDQEALTEACNKKGLIGDAVDHYLSHGNGERGLCFAVSVEHSRSIAARFNAAGVAAAHVDGEMPTRERDKIFAALTAGEIKVVSNCEVASEGLDIPCVKVIILMRPTQSLRLLIQQCGRGSRPCMQCDGCSTRRHCDRQFVVLDHAGNVARHGLPHEDREWSLGSKRKSKKSIGRPLVWCCEECMTCNPLSAAACLTCGETRPLPEKRSTDIVENDGELVEVQPLTGVDRRAACYRIIRQWVDENYKRAKPLKPIWCAHEYKKRYGQDWPSDEQPLPVWTEEEKSRRQRFDADEASRGTRAAWGWGAKRLESRTAEEFLLPIRMEMP